MQVEDTTVVTLDEIEFHFGPAVRNIVEGETKFSKLGQCSPGDVQAQVRGMVGLVSSS